VNSVNDSARNGAADSCHEVSVSGGVSTGNAFDEEDAVGTSAMESVAMEFAGIGASGLASGVSRSTGVSVTMLLSVVLSSILLSWRFPSIDGMGAIEGNVLSGSTVGGGGRTPWGLGFVMRATYEVS